MKTTVVTMMLAVTLLSACANEDNTVGEKKDPAPYPEDGYMGMTYANPNVPTNPTYHTYSKDVVLMSKTVNRIDGVADARYYLNGGNVIINLELEPGLSKQEAEKARQQAQQILARDFPRYTFQVR